MAPIRRTAALALVTAVLVPAAGSGQPPAARVTKTAAGTAPPLCRVEGTWELVSVSADGKARALTGYQQRKMVANGHFMWIGQSARRDTIAMRTSTDSLRATQVLGGSGTYALRPGMYTERLDYFNDPRGIGQTVPASCRVEGEWWTHSFTVPFDTTGATAVQHITEVWRRVP